MNESNRIPEFGYAGDSERMHAFLEHTGHRDRLRQRVEREGFEGFKPHEIIEFLLYYVMPRQDMNQLAHRLIDHFGDVGSVLRADSCQLAQVEGVGPRVANWIMQVGELSKGILNADPCARRLLSNAHESYRYGMELSRGVVPPECWQICLDFNNRLCYQRCIAPSQSWGEPIVMRDALADVFATHASGILLMQFVGEKPPVYSDYDLKHINAYAYTLHASGAHLLDMLIISDHGPLSLRRENKIPEYSRSPELRRLHERYLETYPEEY